MLGIHKGSVVRVENTTGDKVTIIGDFGAEPVPSEEVHLLPTDLQEQIHLELKPIKEKIAGLSNRLANLENTFLTKREALRILYMDARAEEVALINKYLKSILFESKND